MEQMVLNGASTVQNMLTPAVIAFGNRVITPVTGAIGSVIPGVGTAAGIAVGRGITATSVFGLMVAGGLMTASDVVADLHEYGIYDQSKVDAYLEHIATAVALDSTGTLIDAALMGGGRIFNAIPFIRNRSEAAAKKAALDAATRANGLDPALVNKLAGRQLLRNQSLRRQANAKIWGRGGAGWSVLRRTGLGTLQEGWSETQQEAINMDLVNKMTSFDQEGNWSPGLAGLVWPFAWEQANREGGYRFPEKMVRHRLETAGSVGAAMGGITVGIGSTYNQWQSAKARAALDKANTVTDAQGNKIIIGAAERQREAAKRVFADMQNQGKGVNAATIAGVNLNQVAGVSVANFNGITGTGTDATEAFIDLTMRANAGRKNIDDSTLTAVAGGHEVTLANGEKLTFLGTNSEQMLRDLVNLHNSDNHPLTITSGATIEYTPGANKPFKITRTNGVTVNVETLYDNYAFYNFSTNADSSLVMDSILRRTGSQSAESTIGIDITQTGAFSFTGSEQAIRNSINNSNGRLILLDSAKTKKGSTARVRKNGALQSDTMMVLDAEDGVIYTIKLKGGRNNSNAHVNVTARDLGGRRLTLDPDVAKQTIRSAADPSALRNQIRLKSPKAGIVIQGEQVAGSPLWHFKADQIDEIARRTGASVLRNTSNYVEFQLPGYRWTADGQMEEFGTSFALHLDDQGKVWADAMGTSIEIEGINDYQSITPGETNLYAHALQGGKYTTASIDQNTGAITMRRTAPSGAEVELVLGRRGTIDSYRIVENNAQQLQNMIDAAIAARNARTAQQQATQQQMGQIVDPDLTTYTSQEIAAAGFDPLTINQRLKAVLHAQIAGHIWSPISTFEGIRNIIQAEFGFPMNRLMVRQAVSETGTVNGWSIRNINDEEIGFFNNDTQGLRDFKAFMTDDVINDMFALDRLTPYLLEQLMNNPQRAIFDLTGVEYKAAVNKFFAYHDAVFRPQTDTSQMTRSTDRRLQVQKSVHIQIDEVINGRVVLPDIAAVRAFYGDLIEQGYGVWDKVAKKFIEDRTTGKRQYGDRTYAQSLVGTNPQLTIRYLYKLGNEYYTENELVKAAHDKKNFDLLTDDVINDMIEKRLQGMQERPLDVAARGNRRYIDILNEIIFREVRTLLDTRYDSIDELINYYGGNLVRRQTFRVHTAQGYMYVGKDDQLYSVQQVQNDPSIQELVTFDSTQYPSQYWTATMGARKYADIYQLRNEDGSLLLNEHVNLRTTDGRSAVPQATVDANLKRITDRLRGKDILIQYFNTFATNDSINDQIIDEDNEPEIPAPDRSQIETDVRNRLKSDAANAQTIMDFFEIYGHQVQERFAVLDTSNGLYAGRTGNSTMLGVDTFLTQSELAEYIRKNGLNQNQTILEYYVFYNNDLSVIHSFNTMSQEDSFMNELRRPDKVDLIDITKLVDDEFQAEEARVGQQKAKREALRNQRAALASGIAQQAATGGGPTPPSTGPIGYADYLTRLFGANSFVNLSAKVELFDGNLTGIMDVPIEDFYWEQNMVNAQGEQVRDINDPARSLDGELNGSVGKLWRDAKRRGLIEVHKTVVEFLNSIPTRPGQPSMRESELERIVRGMLGVELQKPQPQVTQAEIQSRINSLSTDEQNELLRKHFTPQGYYEVVPNPGQNQPTGRIHFIEENIPWGMGDRVFYHEVGVHASLFLQGEIAERWRTIIQYLKDHKDDDTDLGKAVRAIIRNRGKMGQKKGTFGYWEEVSAYFVADNLNKVSFAARIKAMFRDWFRLSGIVSPRGDITTADIVRFARATTEVAVSRSDQLKTQRARGMEASATFSMMGASFHTDTETVRDQYEAVRQHYDNAHYSHMFGMVHDKLTGLPNYSNLDGTHWVFVRTPVFKKWFGDWETRALNASKIVDTAGEPLLVFHNTKYDHEAYDEPFVGLNGNFGHSGQSIYGGMTENPYAEKFRGNTVAQTFVNMRRPLHMHNYEETARYMEALGYEESARRLDLRKLAGSVRNDPRLRAILKGIEDYAADPRPGTSFADFMLLNDNLIYEGVPLTNTEEAHRFLNGLFEAVTTPANSTLTNEPVLNANTVEEWQETLDDEETREHWRQAADIFETRLKPYENQMLRLAYNPDGYFTHYQQAHDDLSVSTRERVKDVLSAVDQRYYGFGERDMIEFRQALMDTYAEISQLPESDLSNDELFVGMVNMSMHNLRMDELHWRLGEDLDFVTIPAYPVPTAQSLLKEHNRELAVSLKSAMMRDGYDGILGTEDILVMHPDQSKDVLEFKRLYPEKSYNPTRGLAENPVENRVVELLNDDIKRDAKVLGVPAVRLRSEYRSIYRAFREENPWSESNLDEYQWVLTRTPSFKENFGDWQNDVVRDMFLDTNGEPLRTAQGFVHGTGIVDVGENNYFSIAWAGSSSRFDRFSTDYVMSQTGMNIDGWGLYFTDDQLSAQTYALPTYEFIVDGIRYTGGETSEEEFGYIGENGNEILSQGPVYDALRQLEYMSREDAIRYFEETIEFYSSLDTQAGKERVRRAQTSINFLTRTNIEVIPTEGNMYKVDIPEKDEMFDTTVLVSEQSEHVRNALLNFLNENEDKISVTGLDIESLKERIMDKSDETSISGSHLFELFRSVFDSPKALSLALNKAGIKGTIHYNHRGRQDKRDFVIFSDEAVKILERYPFPHRIASPATELYTPSEDEITRYFSMTAVPEIVQAEYDAVVAQYQGTDQWMKAPNGADTRLTERQWVQVRTPSFKAWFGDWENDPTNASQALDENGEPLVLYHGSPNPNKTVFRNRRGEMTESERGFRATGNAGLYFSPKRSYAERYTAADLSSDESGGRVYEVFLNMRNPATLADLGWTRVDKITQEQYQELLDKGYDGIIHRHKKRPEYVVFESNQIKSATDNIGTFSSANNNFYFSMFGRQGAARLLRTSRYELEAQAEMLEAMGRDVNTILLTTGYRRDRDGHWRYEVSNIEHDLQGVFIEPNRVFEYDDEFLLKDVFRAKELYAGYPELANVKVGFEEGLGEGIAYYMPYERKIYLGLHYSKKFQNPEEIRNTLLHEIQHYIQEEEGLPGGTSALTLDYNLYKRDEYKEILKYEKIINDADTPEEFEDRRKQFLPKIEALYKKLTGVENITSLSDVYDASVGENEAIAVSRRSRMIQQELLRRPFELDMPVSPDNQIDTDLFTSSYFSMFGPRGARRLLGTNEYIQIAQRMRNAGKDAQTIKLATGYEWNDDEKKWQYEVSNIKHDFKKDGLRKLVELFYNNLNNKRNNGVQLTSEEESFIRIVEKLANVSEFELDSKRYGISYPLSKVFDAPEIYKAYPNILQSARVKLDISLSYNEAVTTGRKTIGIPARLIPYIVFPNDVDNTADRASMLRSNMLHEIQHVIQYQEEISLAQYDPFAPFIGDESYFNDPAEVEARRVQARRDMTQEELKESLFLNEDVTIEIEDPFDKWVKMVESTLKDRSYFSMASRQMQPSISPEQREFEETIYNSNGEVQEVSNYDLGYFSTISPVAKSSWKAKEELDAEEYITLYRATVMRDGNYYSPMAEILAGEPRPIALGKWEYSVEHPELIVVEKGKEKFKLIKRDGGTVSADYAPYIHSSLSPLNDQFTTAYRRPIVILEIQVPKSELTSGYHAERAKKPVGWSKWKSGPVASKLGNVREVMLSRYAKPTRPLTNIEVAERIREINPELFVQGKKVIPIPINVVTPGLLRELVRLGATVGEPSGFKTQYPAQRAEKERLSQFTEDIRKNGITSPYFTDRPATGGYFSMSSVPQGTQKQANVQYPDASHEILGYFSLTEKRRARYRGDLERAAQEEREGKLQLLKRVRPDLTPDFIESVLDELERYGQDADKEKMVLHWTIRGRIIPYVDRDLIDEARAIVKQKKMPIEEVLTYESPMALIDEYKRDQYKPSGEPIDPESVPEIKKDTKIDYGNGIVSYEVQDDKQGQEAMRRIVDSHFGKKWSKWCLLYANASGLTKHSWEMWKTYSGLPKRAAFKDGRLISFMGVTRSKVGIYPIDQIIDELHSAIEEDIEDDIDVAMTRYNITQDEADLISETNDLDDLFIEINRFITFIMSLGDKDNHSSNYMYFDMIIDSLISLINSDYFNNNISNIRSRYPEIEDILKRFGEINVNTSGWDASRADDYFKLLEFENPNMIKKWKDFADYFRTGFKTMLDRKRSDVRRIIDHIYYVDEDDDLAVIRDRAGELVDLRELNYNVENEFHYQDGEFISKGNGKGEEWYDKNDHSHPNLDWARDDRTLTRIDMGIAVELIQQMNEDEDLIGPDQDDQEWFSMMRRRGVTNYDTDIYDRTEIVGSNGAYKLKNGKIFIDVNQVGQENVARVLLYALVRENQDALNNPVMGRMLSFIQGWEHSQDPRLRGLYADIRMDMMNDHVPDTALLAYAVRRMMADGVNPTNPQAEDTPEGVFAGIIGEVPNIIGQVGGVSTSQVNASTADIVTVVNAISGVENVPIDVAVPSMGLTEAQMQAAYTRPVPFMDAIMAEVKEIVDRYDGASFDYIDGKPHLILGGQGGMVLNLSDNPLFAKNVVDQLMEKLTDFGNFDTMTTDPNAKPGDPGNPFTEIIQKIGTNSQLGTQATEADVNKFINENLPAYIADRIQVIYNETEEYKTLFGDTYGALYRPVTADRKVIFVRAYGRNLSDVIGSIVNMTSYFGWTQYNNADFAPLMDELWTVLKHNIQNDLPTYYAKLNGQTPTSSQKSALISAYLAAKSTSIYELAEFAKTSNVAPDDEQRMLDIAKKVKDEITKVELSMAASFARDFGMNKEAVQEYTEKLLRMTMAPFYGRGMWFAYDVDYDTYHANNPNTADRYKDFGHVMVFANDFGPVYKSVPFSEDALTNKIMLQKYRQVKPVWKKFHLFLWRNWHPPMKNIGETILGIQNTIALNRAYRAVTTEFGSALKTIVQDIQAFDDAMIRKGIDVEEFDRAKGYVQELKDRGITDRKLLEQAEVLDVFLRVGREKMLTNVTDIRALIRDSAMEADTWMRHEGVPEKEIQKMHMEMDRFASRFVTDWEHRSYRAYMEEGQNDLQEMWNILDGHSPATMPNGSVWFSNAARQARQDLTRLEQDKARGVIGEQEYAEKRKEFRKTVKMYERLDALYHWVNQNVMASLPRPGSPNYPQEVADVPRKVNAQMKQEIENVMTLVSSEKARGNLGKMDLIPAVRKRKLNENNPHDVLYMTFLDQIKNPAMAMVYNLDQQGKVLDKLIFNLQFGRSILQSGMGTIKGSREHVNLGVDNLSWMETGTLLRYIKVDPFFLDEIRHEQEIQLNLHDTVFGDIIQVIKQNFTILNWRMMISNYLGNVSNLVATGHFFRFKNWMAGHAVGWDKFLSLFVQTSKKATDVLSGKKGAANVQQAMQDYEATIAEYKEEMEKLNIWGSGTTTVDLTRYGRGGIEKVSELVSGILETTGMIDEVGSRAWNRRMNRGMNIARELYGFGDEWVKTLTYINNRAVAVAKYRAQENWAQYAGNETSAAAVAANNRIMEMAKREAAILTMKETTTWELSPDFARQISASPIRVISPDFLLHSFQMARIMAVNVGRTRECAEEVARLRLKPSLTEDERLYLGLVTNELIRRTIGQSMMLWIGAEAASYGGSAIMGLLGSMLAFMRGEGDDDDDDERRKRKNRKKDDPAQMSPGDHTGLSMLCNYVSQVSDLYTPLMWVPGAVGDKFYAMNFQRMNAALTLLPVRPAKLNPSFLERMEHIMWELIDLRSDTLSVQLANTLRGKDRYGNDLTKSEVFGEMVNYIVPQGLHQARNVALGIKDMVLGTEDIGWEERKRNRPLSIFDVAGVKVRQYSVNDMIEQVGRRISNLEREYENPYKRKFFQKLQRDLDMSDGDIAAAVSDIISVNKKEMERINYAMEAFRLLNIDRATLIRGLTRGRERNTPNLGNTETAFLLAGRDVLSERLKTNLQTKMKALQNPVEGSNMSDTERRKIMDNYRRAYRMISEALR